MTDLDKAREWAEDGKGLYSPGSRAKAVTDIILSLPDQWVDAEKLERIIAGMDCCLTQGSETNFSDGFKEATTTWRDALKALIPPNLPTLADMTVEERKARRWMQCRAKGFSEDERLVIAYVDDHWVTLWREAGHTIRTNPGAVTPLPGPKLEWPGNAPKEPYHFGGTSAESDLPFPGVAEYSEADSGQSSEKSNSSDVLKRGIEDFKAGRFVDFDLEESDSEQQPSPQANPESPIKPEDVPADEIWLVECDGNEWVGKRNRGDEDPFPWRIIHQGKGGTSIANDSEITLIHKLVPETHALPEGMRLADHAEYGRVVVSPAADVGGDYKIFHLDNKNNGRATYRFASPDDLTFLDGEA